MRSAFLSIGLLAASAATAHAQYSPNERPRWPTICWVAPQFAKMRSRPWCEMGEFRPAGASCVCNAYDGAQLPGRARVRR